MSETTEERLKKEHLQASVDSWESLKLEQKALEEKLYNCESIIAQSMAELDAEEFQHGKLLVTYKSKTLWIDGVLEQLKEVLPEFELNVEDFLNKPRVRTWDKRKIAKLSKRGGIFKQIIDSAQTEGAPVIQIKEQG